MDSKINFEPIRRRVSSSQSEARIKTNLGKSILTILKQGQGGKINSRCSNSENGKKFHLKYYFYRGSCIFQSENFRRTRKCLPWNMNSRGVSFVILAYLYSTKQSASSGFIYSNLCNTRCEIMSLTHTSCDTFMTIPIHVTYLLHTQQDKYYKLVQCFFAYSCLFQYFFTF